MDNLYSKYEIYNKKIQNNTQLENLIFHNIESIPANALYYYYGNNNNIRTVNFSDLTYIDEHGLESTFRGCLNIELVEFPNLVSVEYYGLRDTFCNCTGIQSISFPSLTTVADWGMSFTFQNCTSLSGKIYFPSLKNIYKNSLYGIFSSSSSLIEEIHFRNDLESTVQGFSEFYLGVPSSVSIYFDL